MTTPARDPKKEIAEAVGQANAVMEALATIQPGDRVYLYRKSLDTLKYGYLGPIETGEDPAEFLDLVKRRWGGGDYRAVRWGEREDGGKGFIPGGAVLFSIEGRPKYDEPDPKAEGATAAASKLESVVAGLVESIREDRASRSDDLLKMMFESNARMMEAVAARPQAEGADPARFLEVFLEGMDRGREASGDGGGSDPYEGVAARLMDMVQNVTGQAAAAEALPPATEPMDDPPGAAALALRDHLPNLLQAARARIPAEHVAAAVLEGASPEAVSLVLVDPTVIDDVIAMEPRFARWRSWLHDVLAELADLTDDEGGDDESGSDMGTGPGGGSADGASGGGVPG